jgi:tetratricopeptide (TPR) repeat protein
LPRQQTLQALIDWSYELLSEQERDLLCRLAVFVDGWTLETAEEICAGMGLAEWQIPGCLETLVDKSLVLFAAGAEPARYRMLETVRAYSLVKGSNAPWNTTLRRQHFKVYADLAEAGQDLAREYGNLRAALEWSLSAAEIEPAVRHRAIEMVRHLLWHWVGSGQYEEGETWVERAWGHSAGAEPRLQAQIRFAAGILATHRGALDRAYAHLDESVRLFRAGADNRNLGEALMQLAHVHKVRGDLASARTLLEESLHVLQDASDRRSLGWAHSILAGVVGAAGDLEVARRLEREALELFRATDTPDGVTAALSGLGEIAFAQEDYPTARSYLEESLLVAREHQFGNLLPWNLTVLARTAIETGDYALGESLQQECVQMLQAQGAPWSVSGALEGCARLAYLRGDAERAAQLYGAAHVLRSEARALAAHERLRLEREEEAVRASLGEAAFLANREIGRAFSIERTLSVALAEGT